MNRCTICNKGSIMAGDRKKLRGKYNPVNWSKKKPNLQVVKLSPEIYPNILKNKNIKKELIDKKVKICTNCLRTIKKTPKFIEQIEPEQNTQKVAAQSKPISKSKLITSKPAPKKVKKTSKK